MEGWIGYTGIIQNTSDSKFEWIYKVLIFEAKQRNYQYMSDTFNIYNV